MSTASARRTLRTSCTWRTSRAHGIIVGHGNRTGARAPKHDGDGWHAGHATGLLACLDGLDSGLEIGRLVAAEAARRGLAVSHHPPQGVADDGHP